MWVQRQQHQSAIGRAFSSATQSHELLWAVLQALPESALPCLQQRLWRGRQRSIWAWRQQSWDGAEHHGEPGCMSQDHLRAWLGRAGSATISNTGNGSGVGGSGASGSGASNTGQSQATSGAALAPGSIAPTSG